MAQKVRSYEYFNSDEKKNLIRIHCRRTHLVRRFTQGRRRCGGIGGGGGLSFRDADVVPFTFDLDFPEGLSCRKSTVDESGGKTVPYRPWKWRILERVRGRRKRRENWYGKRGGGRGNSTVFMPATLWSQHKKSGSWERLRGKEEGRWTVTCTK